MGKGSRNRKERQNYQTAIRDSLRKDNVKRAVNKEINAQLVKAHDRFFLDGTSVIIWSMIKAREEIPGFRVSMRALKRFYHSYGEESHRLREHYEMSDDDLPWLTRKKLKEDYEIDLDEWAKSSPD